MLGHEGIISPTAIANIPVTRGNTLSHEKVHSATFLEKYSMFSLMSEEKYKHKQKVKELHELSFTIT